MGETLIQTVPHQTPDPVNEQPVLSELYRLVSEHQENAAMQLIYSHFFALRRQHNFAGCDRLLEAIDANRLSPVLLLAVLLITAPSKQHLTHRRAFYEQTKTLISQSRGPEAAVQALGGLE